MYVAEYKNECKMDVSKYRFLHFVAGTVISIFSYIRSLKEQIHSELGICCCSASSRVLIYLTNMLIASQAPNVVVRSATTA